MTQVVFSNHLGNATQSWPYRTSPDQTKDCFNKADAGTGQEVVVPSVELVRTVADTAADVLAKLADQTLSRERLRQSILEAEVVSVDADQANALKPLLRQYIEQNRDSTDYADLIAVTSAIRKYVGILGREEVSSLGFVLDAGHKAPVPTEIEARSDQDGGAETQCNPSARGKLVAGAGQPADGPGENVPESKVVAQATPRCHCLE